MEIVGSLGTQEENPGSGRQAKEGWRDGREKRLVKEQ
jgi:hypothetical protein